MALIVRMDIDRPYGRKPLYRHVMSRVSSDHWLPPMKAAGYLNELQEVFSILAKYKARAYAFFRQCTRPSQEIISLMANGGHEAGLHLENSRSFESYLLEKQSLEKHLGRAVTAFSKHGSGGAKFGRNHYAPYEPENYVAWGDRSGMKHFFGNLEEPEICSFMSENGLICFPAAFWLETPWRDTRKYPVEWLLENGKKRDVVLLIHPENVLASSELTKDFHRLLSHLETKIF
jgi:hypothetical protein